MPTFQNGPGQLVHLSDEACDAHLKLIERQQKLKPPQTPAAPKAEPIQQEIGELEVDAADTQASAPLEP